MSRTLATAGALASVTALLLAAAAPALADVIVDSIDDSGTGVTLVAGSATVGTATVRVNAGNNANDGDDGCNADPGELPLLLNVITPAGVTATPNPLSVPTCKEDYTVTFTASAAAVSGTVTVSIARSPAGDGEYNNNVSIPITVTRSNTAPQVSVTGVSQGAEYVFGTVPTAGCTVTDTEDGLSASTTAATLTGGGTGLGSNTATCSYKDLGGLERSASVIYTVVPPPNKAPVVKVTGVVAGSYEIGTVFTPGCSVVDENASASATPVTTGTLVDGLGDRTVTCSYSDSEFTVSDKVTYTIVDTGDPTITSAVTPAVAVTGWFNALTGAPTVTFSCADTGGSGVKTCLADGTSPASASKTLAEGAAQSVSGTATDNAGNTATAEVTGLDVDLTAPSVSEGVLDRAANEAGWFNAPVTATFTGSDAVSGLVGVAARGIVSSGEGSSVKIQSPAFSDVAGNETPIGARDVTVMIDSEAPRAPTGSVSPAPNAAGWNNSTATVSFASNGDNGASGIDSCTDSVTVAAQTGYQQVTGTCTDLAGNVSDETVVIVKLDTEGPVVTAGTPTGTAGSNGWFTSAATVPFTATDALSGPSTQSGSATTTGEGAGLVLSSPAFTDIAGNTTAAGNKTVTVDVDLTNPTASFDSAIGTVFYGQVPPAPTCTSTDAASGEAGCTVTGYFTSVGTHTLTATAKDVAGRTGTATATYTVAPYAFGGFYQPVDMGGVVNTVKAGSTVPLKFEAFRGATELTSTAIVKTLTKQVTCSVGAPTDDVELTATGGTSLRYDTTGGQFVFNWQTPKVVGTCYSVTVTLEDNTYRTAYFKTK